MRVLHNTKIHLYILLIVIIDGFRANKQEMRNDKRKGNVAFC